MANNTVQFNINLDGSAYTGMVQLDKAMGKLNVTASKSRSLMERIGGVAFNLNNIFQASKAIIGSVKNSLDQCEAAYNIQSQSERKLETVMRQRMKATDDQIASIKRLASEQQKLGIIGDEVQLSGAQQLATFVNQKDSLERLMPAMNNLLAQQHGLNATSQDAVGIGNLMGKVMQGQTSALTRVGVTFTAVQEKALKFGNEQQRAAMLAQVITDNVGQMNQALADTPEGRLKQHANTMGDLQERIGAFYVKIQSVLLPVFEQIAGLSEGLILFFENNQERITGFFFALVEVVSATFSVAGDLIMWFVSALTNTMEFISDLSPLLIGLAVAFGILTVVVNKAKISMMRQNAILDILIIKEKIIILWTKAWAVAQGVLNAIMNANPVALIISAIAVLVGIITYLITKYDDFGAAALLLMGPIGILINGVMAIKNNWDSIVEAFQTDGVLGGLKRIGVVLLDAVLYPVQQLLELLAKIPGMAGLASGGAQKIADIRARLNLHTPQKVASAGGTGQNNALISAANGQNPSVGGNGKSGGLIEKATSGSSGGSGRSTSISITVGKFFENIVYNGSVRESKNEIEKVFEECLIRALNTARGAV